jgi:hypothetical protein
MAKSLVAWANTLTIVVASLMVSGCGIDRSDDVSAKTPIYSIGGNQVQLEDGFFEGEDGTVSLLTAISGDLNGDAVDDHAAILVLDSRGSGVFYYLNVLLNDGNGKLGKAREALLGDRIKFDFMDIYGTESVSRLTGVPIHPEDYGKLVVGYYIQGDDQAYADDPGLYITRHWKIEMDRLVLDEDY